MQTGELAKHLKRRIDSLGGKPYPSVHLFGIEFADELEGQNLKEICLTVGISHNYSTEISKGRRLAPFVTLKG